MTSGTAERDAALQLLGSDYHRYYLDLEMVRSPCARFAKSVDKIAPDIYDYLSPAHVTIQRFHRQTGVSDPEEIVNLIAVTKGPYMHWNPFMATFHSFLMNRLLSKLRRL